MKSQKAVILPLLAVALSACFSGCGMREGTKAAEMAVNEFHQKLDAGEFTAIYSATHPDFKKASTEKDFVALLEAIHRKLGRVETTNQAGWNVNSHNLNTNVTLNYQTKFAGGDAVETFNYRVKGGKALLYGYNINSQALIIK
jgi:hypothetical protein